YALDFWGFGESGKQGGTFTVQDYVEMVYQFMERLGIEQAPIIGHSMGGTVSLCLALDHPERVQKVAVVGSPNAGAGRLWPGGSHRGFRAGSGVGTEYTAG
ncbi:MAG: alpha/beta fold hydrolase, partial [Chloroflexi bacterium]|nr:alpha/beta fold hydrolase [Chloroflexota bacterium]